MVTVQSSCSTQSPGPTEASHGAVTFDRGAALDVRVPLLLASHHAAGAAVAVIRNSRVVWTGYYGEQGPGVPTTRETMFNTASLAKTITAQTVLRMAALGKVSLDEPIADYYVDPHLAGDPRYQKLTPRLILSHQSGLLNWPSLYQDGKLAFVTDPGTSFGYSGAGSEILAHFLEQKLDTDFETLVRKAVFDPIGMTGVSMSRRRSIDARITTLMDSNGVYGKPYTSDQPHPAGSSWNAADDLFVTVEDYARFLIGVARHEGLNSVLAAEQTRLHSSFSGVSEWECIPEPSLRCPDRYGFGLGWMVFEYGNTVIIQNGGNDSGEHALVYFSPNAPGDATVIFVNGGNGILVTLDIIDLIDDRQKFVAYYRQLIDRAQRSR